MKTSATTRSVARGLLHGTVHIEVPADRGPSFFSERSNQPVGIMDGSMGIARGDGVADAVELETGRA
ncbi:MAG: hypothetical protein RJA94_3197, partial [Pseudomonadota bacterium]